MDTSTDGWRRADSETPKQTSDRIIRQMQKNARSAQREQKK